MALSKKKYFRKKCKCGQRWCECIVGKHRDWVGRKRGKFLDAEQKVGDELDTQQQEASRAFRCI